MRRGRVVVGWALVALASVTAACGDDGGDGSAGGAPPDGEVADGPVTLVALGDSLTAGEGDEDGGGFLGPLVAAIDGIDGRAGSEAVNLGQSGWDSTAVVEGQDGASAQLSAAVDAVTSAVEAGRAAVATVLVGSNDLWYLYDAGSEDPTPPGDEDAAEATFRANLERIVTELRNAGAVVVLGLPDDQTVRPGVVDLDVLHQYLPNVSEGEVGQMSAMAGRLGDVVEAVAADLGAATVDTNDALWSDPSTMADDGIHPNGAGYARLAELWFGAIEPLLS